MIYDRLRTDEALNEMLARFDGGAAVFYQRAPKASNGKWGAAEYPRMDFSLDWKEETQRGALGALIVNIWCSQREGMEPELIEAATRGALHMAFTRPDKDYAYGFFWARTDAFEAGAANGIYGATLLFDLLSVATGGGCEPCAAQALNNWMSESLPSFRAIGAIDEGCWGQASNDSPYYAWRVAEEHDAEAMFACQWRNGVARGHLYAPDAEKRRAAAGLVRDRLSAVNHLALEQDGPMLLQGVSLPMDGEYLMNGQIEARYRYGRIEKKKTEPGGERLAHVMMRGTG